VGTAAMSGTPMSREEFTDELIEAGRDGGLCNEDMIVLLERATKALREGLPSRLLRLSQRKRTTRAATTGLVDQHINVYGSSSLTDVEQKEGQVVWEKELQFGLSVLHVPQPFGDSRQSAPVAAEIRETLTALVINAAA
jgi:hypothetical protein